MAGPVKPLNDGGAVRFVEAADPTGSAWLVNIITPGLSRNGRNVYPPEVLKSEDTLRVFEGAVVKAHDFEGYLKEIGSKIKAKFAHPQQILPDGAPLTGPDATIGVLTDVRFNEAEGDAGALQGTFTFAENPLADKLRQTASSIFRKLKVHPFEFSINAAADWIQSGGRRVATRFKEAWLDLVDVGTACKGGVFKEMLEGMDPTLAASVLGVEIQPGQNHTEQNMNKEKLIALLEKRGHKRDALEAMSDDSLVSLLDAAIATPQPPQVTDNGKALEALRADLLKEIGERIKTEDDKRMAEAKVTAWRDGVRARLDETKLPASIKAGLAAKHATPADTRDALEADIKDTMKELDTLTGGAPRIVVDEGNTKNPTERITEALVLGMSDKSEERAKGIGWRQAYIELTGDGLISGDWSRNPQRLAEAVVSATFSGISSHAAGARLVQGYGEVSYDEDVLISFKKNVTNFKTQTAYKLGGFGDLATVADGAAFPTITNTTQASVTYTPATYGGVLAITRRAIINDELDYKMRQAQEIGRAARRTHGQFCWDFFINNTTYADDSVAIFNAAHGSNTAASALSVTALNTALAAMFNQTQAGSSKKLGNIAVPKYCVLPINLRGTALSIFNGPYEPGSANNTANAWFKYFGMNNENVRFNPLFSDTDDWYLFADNRFVDILEVGYYNGQEQPEFIVQDKPTDGAAFTADVAWTLKVRHEYGGAVTDYRGAYKGTQ